MNASKQVEPTNQVSNCVCACVHAKAAVDFICDVDYGSLFYVADQNASLLALALALKYYNNRRRARKCVIAKAMRLPQPEPTIREMQHFRYDARAQRLPMAPKQMDKSQQTVLEYCKDAGIRFILYSLSKLIISSTFIKACN